MREIKMKNIVLALGALIFATGCASAAKPVVGVIYSDVKFAQNATDASGASKTGMACAQSILGIVAMGDASLQAAKKDGNITTVSSVDGHSTNILGFFAKYCTIVKGN